jgi:hypothetical protein
MKNPKKCENYTIVDVEEAILFEILATLDPP